MTKLIISSISSAFLLSLALSLSARADTVDLFTKLSGTFRGSGVSIVGSRGKKQRVSCQLTNAYKKDSAKISAGKLKVSGKCATSKGSGVVSGSVNHVGDAVSGTYFSLRSDTKNTRSTGRAKENSMVIYSAFVENRTGNLIKIRQRLYLTPKGFRAEFSTFDNKTKNYKSAGKINFRRK